MAKFKIGGIKYETDEAMYALLRKLIQNAVSEDSSAVEACFEAGLMTGRIKLTENENQKEKR